MTAVATPNSFQGNIDVVATNPFLTQGISDPVIQQNFEILNKLLFNKLSGKNIEKANIVFSPAIVGAAALSDAGGSTSAKKPGQLQLQISTRGNPVRIKLAPFQYQSSAISTLIITQTAGNSRGNNASCTFGWYRINQATGITSLVASTTTGHGITPKLDANLATPTTEITSFNVPLPAFEFDDVVPTGVYTYQFFYQFLDTVTGITGANINAVAYELR